LKHLGDITQIKGSEVPIVDIVTGGSPCQDLSVAGKRAGLAGERSGLFMEQIRIIKEMREHDRSTRAVVDIRLLKPRFMVWENVPGAFSSNKGEDFRAVLEETARIAEKDAVIPRPETGKWAPSGCIMGDGWSIAWRVHDAQFWGVPQRRKRIALVADFGGASAPEILFERESMLGNSTESREEGERVAEDAERGIGETSRAVSFQERAGKAWWGKGILIQNERTGALSTLNNQSVCCLNDQGGSVMGVSKNVTGALRAQEHGHQPIVFGISAYESNAMKSGNPHSGVYVAETARTLDLNGGSPACNQGGMAVVHNGVAITSPINASNPLPGDPCHTLTEDNRNYLVQAAGVDTYNQTMDDEVAQPLRAADGGDSTPKVVCLEGNGSRPSHQGDGWHEGDPMYTLNSTEHHAVAVENPPADSRVKISEDGMVQTLSSRMGTGGGNVPMVMEEPYNATTGSFMRAGNSGVAETLAARDYKDPQIVCNSVVRRLTPLECERLQGYPDGWTDIGDWIDSKGKKHKGESDSPRYKALGNSIALPFWQWMAKRMVKVLKNEGDENPTMASLFDGIGGFPLVYQRSGCEPIWASEIEEFPIAVTKIRFPDKEV